MSILDLIKYIIIIPILTYFAGVISHILQSVGFGDNNYLIEAFLPQTLIDDISSGNYFFIIILIVIFIVYHVRGKRVDYWEGRPYGSEHTRWWWDDWF